MNDQGITEVVLRFAADMNKWEIDCAARYGECKNGLLDFDESARIAMEQYQVIFDHHCSLEATPRDYHFSMPPAYDPERMSVQQVEAGPEGLRDVYIQNLNGLNDRFVFRLRFEQEEWKILEKFYIGHDGRLIEANL